MEKRVVLINKERLKEAKNEAKKNAIITEWQNIKSKGKRVYIKSQLKKDALLGLLLGTAMHFRIGMSLIEYFSFEFAFRVIIYTSVYSFGSVLFSLYKWKSIKKKYKVLRK